MEFSFYMIMLLKYKLYKYQTWRISSTLYPGYLLMDVADCGEMGKLVTEARR